MRTIARSQPELDRARWLAERFGSAARPARAASGSATALAMLAFVAVHIPLAVLLSKSAALSTMHCLATLGVGVWVAATSARRPERVALACAYVVGAEVLWRMTGAGVFWEIGKYGVSFILLVAIVRRGSFRLAPIPLGYVALLVPSAFLTLAGSDWDEARALLSGNMSGPLALALSGWFFSGVSLTREKTRSLFLAIIAPTVSVATVALLGIAASPDIVFGDDSNFAASGGFGPNQVSAALGLGAALCFFMLVDDEAPLKLRAPLACVLVLLAAQSALTFSRGGLYNAAIAIGVSSLFLLKDAATRVRFVLVVAVVLGVGTFVVFPRLDAFTGGALTTRFEDTNLTNRGEIAKYDLEIWADDPLLGVGPGMARSYRAQLGIDSAAHTEFTRLLAEHGTLGAGALVLVLIGSAANARRAPTARTKAATVAFVTWSFAYMLNAAMRLVAPSFLLGLTFVTWAGERSDARRAPPTPDAGDDLPDVERMPEARRIGPTRLRDAVEGVSEERE